MSVGCSAKGKTTECVNPLTYTDIPDNDWIRVGNDYYMVSTTMYFCPGAPIMHSKDLVDEGSLQKVVQQKLHLFELQNSML